MRLRTFLLLLALLDALAPGSAAAAREDQFGPAVAFDGVNYLVVWQDHRAGPSGDVYGARVSQAGVVLDPRGLPISTARGTQGRPSVAFAGDEFLVVWEDDRSPGKGTDVYAARVSPAGAVLDPAGIPVAATPAAERTPAVAATATGSLVVWAGPAGVRGARVDSAGGVLDPLGIAVAPAGAVAPAVAAGASALVAWEDAAADVRAARISPTGAVLDPGGIAVAATAAAERAPAVSSDGSSFVVAWESAGGVFATRIGAGGGMLLPAPLAVAAAAARPALAYGGTSTLVAWHAGADVYAARVGPTGTLLDPAAIPISTAGGSQADAAVAFGVSAFLLAWEDGRAGPGRSDVFGARLGTAGALLDTGGIPVPAARDVIRPSTRITAGVRGRRTARTAVFRFASSEPGSTFHCKLDRRPWRPCVSPQRLRGLSRARHVFLVRAQDRMGNVDATPSTRRWRVAEPVPGLLRTVPGQSRRSGPGPLRRYAVQIEDGIPVDRRAVAETIERILADRRSWGGTGRVSFQRVSSGSVHFRVVLATPATTNRLCLPLNTGGIYSCGLHGRAVLNLMRWQRGAPAFGRDLTRYRQYLVNHEVGHLLGRSHIGCHQAGARAPVMMQQTKGVGSCRANGWPLSWERG